jgi:hypothetical protein
MSKKKNRSGSVSIVVVDKSRDLQKISDPAKQYETFPCFFFGFVLTYSYLCTRVHRTRIFCCSIIHSNYHLVRDF